MPLRSCSDDEANRPGWGPLGQRVSLLAHKPRKNKQKRQVKQFDVRVNPDERTPLMQLPLPTAYAEAMGVVGAPIPINREWKRLSQVDEMSGTWPEKLANVHVCPFIYEYLPSN